LIVPPSGRAQLAAAVLDLAAITALMRAEGWTLTSLIWSDGLNHPKFTEG
jgi:hypothetical protein